MHNKKILLVLGSLTLILCFAPVEAQENPAAAQVRALNNSFLRIQGELPWASRSQAALLHSQAVSVIEQRATALSALIEQDARQALALGFSPDLVAALAAQFPQAASRLESYGTWQGPLEYLIIDDATMTQPQFIRRMQVGQRTFQLYFAAPEPAGLKSGELLRASGMLVGTTLAVSSASIEGSTVAATACSPTGAQNTAVLLVTFPDAALPTSVTPQSVYDIFFAPTGRSVDAFWKETSCANASAAGDVFGWYTLNGSYSCSVITQLRDDAIAAASAAGVNFQNYSRIFIVFPDTIGCGWAGMALVGCMTLTSPTGSFTASTSYLVAKYLSNRDQGVELATHEGGHNLGLGHASARDFGVEALGPVGATGTLSEYGDSFSTMGHWNLGQYGAPHKAEELSWLTSTNYQIVQSNGTYSLEPLESCPAGLKALKVQRGTGNEAWLWVEYRQPLGDYDSTLPNQVFSGALIHYQDSITGIYTHLLDFTPETDFWVDPALVNGKSWADPYTSVSLSIQGVTANALTVSVDYGIAPCTRANPSVNITPLNPSVNPGTGVEYAVSVTNNDAAGCSSSTFALDSAQPTDWPTTLSASTLTVSPGQSATVRMSKNAPTGTAPGTYAVDANAANGSFFGTGTANCTVVAASVLSVSLSVPASVYTTRKTVSITATVLNGSSPAAGASVIFTVTQANGRKVTKKLTADSSGTAIWNYRIGPKDPLGTYSVVASAAAGAQTATSNTVTFSVQ